MPVVRVSLHIPGINQSFVAIDFLLDTGATATCLHPQDAIAKVGIDPAALTKPGGWSNRTSSQGIGGPAGYYIEPAVYAFLHDDGRVLRIPGEIRIAEPTSTNGALPSLLGWDVLQHFRIDLDISKQRVALEELPP